MPEWILTWGGFWVGVLGLLSGIVGVVWGFWTRAHPPMARLYANVQTVPIGIPNDPRVAVHYDDQPLAAPCLVNVQMQHVGGAEIESFEAGAVQFEITAESSGEVKGLLGSGIDEAELDGSTVSIKPRIFKTGERLDLTAIADGDLEFINKIRIANVKLVSSTQVERGKTRYNITLMVMPATLAYGAIVTLLAWFQSGNLVASLLLGAILILFGLFLVLAAVAAYAIVERVTKRFRKHSSRTQARS